MIRNSMGRLATPVVLVALLLAGCSHSKASAPRHHLDQSPPSRNSVVDPHVSALISALFDAGNAAYGRSPYDGAMASVALDYPGIIGNTDELIRCANLQQSRGYHEVDRPVLSTLRRDRSFVFGNYQPYWVHKSIRPLGETYQLTEKVQATDGEFAGTFDVHVTILDGKAYWYQGPPICPGPETSTGSSSSTSTSSASVVRMKVSGTGPAMLIGIGYGPVEYHTQQALPFETTVPAGKIMYVLTAEDGSGASDAAISCEIDIPGKAPIVVSSTGPFTAAFCSAP